MRELVLLAVLFAAAYCGFALLAASQVKNWSRLMGKSHRSRRVALSLRLVGYGLLAGSLPLALVRDGTTFGALLWGCFLSAAAIAVALTLTWRPLWLRVLVAPFSRSAP
jgi:hypothetical protein